MITLYHGEDITASRNAIPKGVVNEPLFGQKRTVLIENPKNPSQIIDDNDVDTVVWFDHQLTPGQLKSFTNAKIQEFKLNQVVFKFVESIVPKNQKEMLPLFEKYCEQEIPEIIFSMVIRQFRLMLNPEQLNSWQKDKIISQIKSFPIKSLRQIYHQLLEIDYQQKTGQAPLDLKGSLELFLLKL